MQANMDINERDAVSLGGNIPPAAPALIMQVSSGEETELVSYQEAVRGAIREEMHRDTSVFIMGEDIAEHGGAFGVTRTLFDEIWGG